MSNARELAELSGSYGTGGFVGMKNRIINGDFRIDQRNAGASKTPANGEYLLDRWRVTATQSAKFSVQQNAGSITPPIGFTNYLGVTSLAATSLGAGDVFCIQQFIEANNVSDFSWGTVSASSISLSFWIRSSLTGTFGGSIENSGATRAYPFTYTISSANTWEQKTISIAGDTVTALTTGNGIGLRVFFGLGVGATYSGTANTWATADYLSATGATSVVGTNGATFYITGVQLEKGSTATSFDYRPYGTEVALCQRYLPCFNSTSTNSPIGSAFVASATLIRCIYSFKTTPRVQPTGISVSSASHFSYGGAGTNPTAVAFEYSSLDNCVFTYTVTGATTNAGTYAYAQNAAGQIQFTGCEL